MPDNFQAEAVSSGDQIFATDQNASDSAHYPIGKIAHGALNTFTLTDSASPFPVRAWGNESSTTPIFVTGSSDSPVPVELLDGASISVSNLNDTIVTVTGYVAPSTTITITNDSTDPVGVTNDSSNPMFVRGVGNSAVTVITDTVITVTNIADNDTTVSVTANASTAPYVVELLAAASISVSNLNDTIVTVTGYTSSMSLNASSVQAGALQTFTTVLSSAIESATSSVARLYGWYITNPDTANFVYAKIFDDDSTGVTKGTTAAHINLGIPPQGGANVFTPQGIAMSSGISMLSAGGTGTTDTSAPSTSLVVTLFYED